MTANIGEKTIKKLEEVLQTTLVIIEKEGFEKAIEKMETYLKEQGIDKAGTYMILYAIVKRNTMEE